MHDILFKQIMNRWNQSNTSRINPTQVESHHNRWNRSHLGQIDEIMLQPLNVDHIGPGTGDSDYASAGAGGRAPWTAGAGRTQPEQV